MCCGLSGRHCKADCAASGLHPILVMSGRGSAAAGAQPAWNALASSLPPLSHHPTGLRGGDPGHVVSAIDGGSWSGDFVIGVASGPTCMQRAGAQAPLEPDPWPHRCICSHRCEPLHAHLQVRSAPGVSTATHCAVGQPTPICCVANKRSFTNKDLHTNDAPSLPLISPRPSTCPACFWFMSPPTPFMQHCTSTCISMRHADKITATAVSSRCPPHSNPSHHCNPG